MNLSEPYIKHKLTITDYYRMGDAGILHEKDRVELIEGELIDMAPIGSNHAGIIAQLSSLLSVLVVGKAVVWSQNPLHLNDHSVPQPDIMLLKPRSDFYKRALPKPADVLVLIEVADSSLAYDRNTKLPLYARNGIQEFWVVDLNAKFVERYSNPNQTGYGHKETLAENQSICPLELQEVKIDLVQLFS